eukprot:NODE_171_length_3058_cov_85.925383_g158_i0.p1 GENE.NODE_171_length_3058_cov_85.925383_g158_i0~~NODE_171_length_3058_cov_85.925383_g158_i0.p1  ORF type:complete len:935 (-),score=145.08 NODE_171_length_3058_cov_85.925383_g158_i0:179-2983(-)
MSGALLRNHGPSTHTSVSFRAPRAEGGKRRSASSSSQTAEPPVSHDSSKACTKNCCPVVSWHRHRRLPGALRSSSVGLQPSSPTTLVAPSTPSTARPASSSRTPTRSTRATSYPARSSRASPPTTPRERVGSLPLNSTPSPTSSVHFSRRPPEKSRAPPGARTRSSSSSATAAAGTTGTSAGGAKPAGATTRRVTSNPQRTPSSSPALRHTPVGSPSVSGHMVKRRSTTTTSAARGGSVAPSPSDYSFMYNFVGGRKACTPAPPRSSSASLKPAAPTTPTPQQRRPSTLASRKSPVAASATPTTRRRASTAPRSKPAVQKATEDTEDAPCNPLTRSPVAGWRRIGNTRRSSKSPPTAVAPVIIREEDLFSDGSESAEEDLLAQYTQRELDARDLFPSPTVSAPRTPSPPPKGRSPSPTNPSSSVSPGSFTSFPPRCSPSPEAPSAATSRTNQLRGSCPFTPPSPWQHETQGPPSKVDYFTVRRGSPTLMSAVDATPSLSLFYNTPITDPLPPSLSDKSPRQEIVSERSASPSPASARYQDRDEVLAGSPLLFEFEGRLRRDSPTNESAEDGGEVQMDTVLASPITNLSEETLLSSLGLQHKSCPSENSPLFDRTPPWDHSPESRHASPPNCILASMGELSPLSYKTPTPTTTNPLDHIPRPAAARWEDRHGDLIGVSQGPLSASSEDSMECESIARYLSFNRLIGFALQEQALLGKEAAAEVPTLKALQERLHQLHHPRVGMDAAERRAEIDFVLTETSKLLLSMRSSPYVNEVKEARQKVKVAARAPLTVLEPNESPRSGTVSTTRVVSILSLANRLYGLPLIKLTRHGRGPSYRRQFAIHVKGADEPHEVDVPYKALYWWIGDAPGRNPKYVPVGRAQRGFPTTMAKGGESKCSFTVYPFRTGFDGLHLIAPTPRLADLWVSALQLLATNAS